MELPVNITAMYEAFVKVYILLMILSLSVLHPPLLKVFLSFKLVFLFNFFDLLMALQTFKK